MVVVVAAKEAHPIDVAADRVVADQGTAGGIVAVVEVAAADVDLAFHMGYVHPARAVVAADILAAYSAK